MAARWDDEDRAMHRRFREGVAAWVAAMPVAPVEYLLLDLRPEIPEDEIAWAAAYALLAWGLSGNWDHELLRAWISERAGDEAVDTLLPPAAAGTAEHASGALHGAIFDALPTERRSWARTTGSWRDRTPRAGSPCSRTTPTCS